MTVETINEQYIGSGIVYVDGRDVGNVSTLDFSLEVETKTRPSYRPGGGNIASSSRVRSVSLSATLDSFNNSNLSLALRGVVDIKESKAITNESITAIVPGLVETSEMLDISKTITVKSVVEEGSEDIPVTFEKGVDFEVTAAGIKPLSTGDIKDGDALIIDYTTRNVSALQALVESGKEVKMIFDGINDDNGRPSVVKVPRWKPAPASGLSLIGDDYGEFQLAGDVLADDSITETGKSKFFVREAASA
ncbi:hypothetical protein OW492_00495 [Psychromonas sp. 14N.309.X.WAT.B.A12]|uniref:phage tail tube protein n=1 Tax=Psychromonas sp. 14N.309.X.WAT.B.A12 TaxID=2998322 RepID=UPI0025AF6417|nr:hypothetical protein [Psychromonas sp. 14N.309.X.WAT.B.A12]MDN2661850.1 hypothetical protein [Psychromonas sp. 14N.309.X.WAT.B.A12]